MDPTIDQKLSVLMMLRSRYQELSYYAEVLDTIEGIENPHLRTILIIVPYFSMLRDLLPRFEQDCRKITRSRRPDPYEFVFTQERKVIFHTAQSLASLISYDPPTTGFLYRDNLDHLE